MNKKIIVKIIVLLLQFIIMSFLTFGETILFYVKIIMRTHSKETLWTGILLGSMIIMIINEVIILLLKRYTKLRLSYGIVVVLSSVAAYGLCFVSALLFDHHNIFYQVDFNKEIDYFMLLFFSLWVIFWSLIGGIVLHITRKKK